MKAPLTPRQMISIQVAVGRCIQSHYFKPKSNHFKLWSHSFVSNLTCLYLDLVYFNIPKCIFDMYMLIFVQRFLVKN